MQLIEKESTQENPTYAANWDDFDKVPFGKS
jgi:hypothetical protein